MHIITNSFKVGNETRNGIKENSLERGDTTEKIAKEMNAGRYKHKLTRKNVS